MSENKSHGFKPQESNNESDKTKHDSSMKAARENSGTNEQPANAYQHNFNSFGEGMLSVDAFGINYGSHIETANTRKSGTESLMPRTNEQSHDFVGHNSWGTKQTTRRM